jgi:hypothetical protein
MEHIIYRVFSRGNNEHPYAYASSDILTRPNGVRDSAWDILLIDKVALDSNKFKPIFIEVKSSVSNAGEVLGDMKTKIDHTLALLRSQSGLNHILGQLPEEVDPPNLSVETPEFVVFSPSHYYHPLYRRATLENQPPDPDGRPLILWSFENSGISSNCISIPYFDEPHVTKCRHITRNGKIFIVCKHDDDKLNDWINACTSQNLGTLGAIMPSGNGFTDIAVNILAILTTGRVFNSSVDKLSKADIRDKIKNFFNTYRILTRDEFIERIITVMETCQILMPNDDLLTTYSLNTSVSEKTKRADDLVEDIVKRLVKNNFGLPSETLDGN